MYTSSATSRTAPSLTNAIVALHNHVDNNPPSSGDIYGFIDRAVANAEYATRYVITVNGTVYALVITDKQAAIAFNQNYPRQPGINGMSPDFPDEIMQQINMMKGWYGATEEMAIAFILNKYRAGIALLRGNSTGVFKKLNTEETTDSSGEKHYKATSCN